MSRAAIMSFLPLLSKIVPESISKMEKGRYYRNRFVAISEVSLIQYTSFSCNIKHFLISKFVFLELMPIIILVYRNGLKNIKRTIEETEQVIYKMHT